jgi:Flp pilus assembly pilin Flp
MLKLITKLQADVSGATAIEYGLIAALVSVASIGALGCFDRCAGTDGRFARNHVHRRVGSA